VILVLNTTLIIAYWFKLILLLYFTFYILLFFIFIFIFYSFLFFSFFYLFLFLLYNIWFLWKLFILFSNKKYLNQRWIITKAVKWFKLNNDNIGIIEFIWFFLFIGVWRIQISFVIDYGSLDATNTLKHSLISQFLVKFLSFD